MIRSIAAFAAGLRRRTPEPVSVAAAAGAAVLLALTVLLADPPYATGDEPPHVDYAYQVWHGELPVFEEGLDLRPEGAWLAPVQWTSQHPPLYYLLVAPLVGPLADAGHPVAAVYAARAVNVLLAGLFVVTAWWSARRICRPGSPLPPLVAFVAGLAAAVAHAGGSGYNDLLAAVGVTAMYGVTATAIRRGLDARLVVALSLLAAGCALTRLSTAVIAVVVAAFAVLAGSVRAAQGRGRWGPVVGLLIAGPTTALAAAGWFYARNLELTGNLQGSHFEWAAQHQNRVVRPVWEVVLDPVTWARLPDLFWWAGRVPPRDLYPMTTLVVTAVLLLWTPLLLALLPMLLPALRGLRARLPSRPTHRDRWLVAALPWTAAGIAVVVQVLFAANGGGVYPRYLLPVALPVCLAVAAGLAWRPRLLVPLWTAVATADLAVWLSIELSTPAEPGRYSEPVVLAATAGTAAVVASIGAAVAVLRAYRAATTTADTTTQTVTTAHTAS